MICLKCLDLLPVLGTALLVFAVLLLRDDTFEAMFFDRLEKLDACLLHMVGEPNPAGVIGNQLPQHGLPLDEWKLHKAVSVEVQEIECVKINRYLPVGFGNV